MKAKPIVFRASEVRALLAGTKTQTRRIAKSLEACPYGQLPGSLLLVRETWSKAMHPITNRLFYRADGDVRGVQTSMSYIEREGNWRPATIMPSWASRITDVRLQRLQDISEEDARDEGVRSNRNTIAETGFANNRDAFRALWAQTHGPASWDDNPFVWALTFEVIKGNVDTVIEDLKWKS